MNKQHEYHFGYNTQQLYCLHLPWEYLLEKILVIAASYSTHVLVTFEFSFNFY